MTRVARRWVSVLVLACSAPVAFAQTTIRRPAGDEVPTQETLKRLAQQLGAGGVPSDIDPALVQMAMEYLKKNPQVLDDPNFKQQMKQWQEQAKSDPSKLAEQFKQQNPSITPEQIESLKNQFKQSNGGGGGGGGFKPPNVTNPQPTPPTGTGPTVTPPIPPPVTDPKNPGNIPPVAQPWQPPRPGMVNIDPTGLGPSPTQKAEGKAEYQQVVGLWENNFGSIEQTPELKKSLVDMFSGDGQGPWDGKGGGLNGMGGTKPGSQKPWWDTSSSNGQQSGFISWLKNTGNNPPSWWKNMGNWNNTGPPPKMGGGSWNAPQYSGGGGGGGFGGGGDFGSAALPILVFVGVLVAVAAAFVVWRYWPQIQAQLNKPKAIPGLGPWTIDPREVKDRETLVKAFEYLSVLICGDGARVWNHLTIAEAFRQNVPGAAPFADPLARLYALARYSPANEPISAEDIAEARGYLCRLAEVQA